MALKRTNGEPPGKKKAQQEIKVTAKTPYGVSAQTGGKVKLKGVSLKESEGKYTAETANSDYEKAVKGGGMVSIYDKSVDPTTRKLVLGSIGSSDALGKRTDIAIDKNFRAKSYEDIYGKGSNFNPEEFRAASKGPDFDKYLKQKGISAGQSFVPQFGYQSRYETEADRKKEKDVIIGTLRTDLGKPSDVKLTKLPLLKPEKIATKTTGIQKAEEEKSTWTNPAINLVSVEKTFTTRSGKDKTRNVVSKAVENVKRKAEYKQELKQGKAYFGGFEGQNAGDISETRKELKQQIKDVRKGNAAPMESISKRERIQGYKSELNKAKQAGKYIKNLGNEFTMSGATAGENIKRVGPNAEVVAKKTGRIRFATPETFKDYRSSTDNPANRNKTFGRKP
jgi:hypothetical protein